MIDPTANGEAIEAARSAGLRYVYDTMPGIRRVRAGKSFSYLAPDGSRIRDAEEVARIRALAIPPAWTDVWICPSDRGHIQATGRDARGRKQYRYHPRWRAVRDETKFDKMRMFAEALPKVRRRVQRDLRLAGLPRERVLAAVVGVMDRTFIRVGSDEYARDNGSYGLTTMRAKHVRVNGSSIHFEFRGKAGRMHAVSIDHPRCARVLKRCRELPGYRLFQYVDDGGERRTIDSDDVNEYLRETTGEAVTAKDFRTWAGSVLFARALAELGPAASKRVTTYNVNVAVEAVASMLGNTKAVCRRCYVHPQLIQWYEDGSFAERWERAAGAKAAGLRPDEARVLAMLRRGARAGRRTARAPVRQESLGSTSAA